MYEIQCYPTDKAAEILEVSVERVEQFCREGRLGQKVGNRWLIHPEDLKRFAKIPRPTGRRPKNTTPVERP